jgi:hypothetical protein
MLSGFEGQKSAMRESKTVERLGDVRRRGERMSQRASRHLRYDALARVGCAFVVRMS